MRRLGRVPIDQTVAAIAFQLASTHAVIDLPTRLPAVLAQTNRPRGAGTARWPRLWISKGIKKITRPAAQLPALPTRAKPRGGAGFATTRRMDQVWGRTREEPRRAAQTLNAFGSNPLDDDHGAKLAAGRGGGFPDIAAFIARLRRNSALQRFPSIVDH
jgi:hypothetical protein